MAQPDLSKIVSIIMENPKLVEEIREMVSKSEESVSSAEESREEAEDTIVAKATEVSSEATYKSAPQIISHTSRRNELLRAMQPYVSKERSKAIESMITIADLLLAFRQE